ncbi:MAG TPA: septum site-determining protein MinC [Kofleriaceae bacterium]|nr:septum site-determining protein MinC [Kofleriaceae bacterium]
MSQAPSLAVAAVSEDDVVGAPATTPGKADHVSLRGTTRGLEILIAGTPSKEALGAQLTELFAEAPSFFAGSSARVAFDGALPAGALACLEEVATRFQLTLVEIAPVARRSRSYAALVRRPQPTTRALAEGTGPIAEAACEPRDRDPAAATTELPALPIEPAACAPDPVDIAFANTRPYSAAATAGELFGAGRAAGHEVPAAERARDLPAPEAAEIEAALARAVPVTVPVTGIDEAGAGSTRDRPAGQAAHAASGARDPLASPDHSAGMETAVGRAVRAEDALAAPDEAATQAAIAAAAAAMASEMAAGMAAKLAEELAAKLAAELAAQAPSGPRVVIGPVRSGVIVDHTGHVIVIGDVNPGAEVRAEGSIIVLGRLRGVAHAAIGREAGCIIALSLQPQQLRIGRMVARAADADRPSGGAEIAYATGETIVVERFGGRLPSGLAASM